MKKYILILVLLFAMLSGGIITASAEPGKTSMVVCTIPEGERFAAMTRQGWVSIFVPEDTKIRLVRIYEKVANPKNSKEVKEVAEFNIHHDRPKRRLKNGYEPYSSYGKYLTNPMGFIFKDRLKNCSDEI